MVVSVRMHENDMSRLHTRSNAQARAAGAQQRVFGPARDSDRAESRDMTGRQSFQLCTQSLRPLGRRLASLSDLESGGGEDARLPCFGRVR